MKNLILILFSISFQSIHAQSFYKMSGKMLTLSNGIISREVKIDNDSIYSSGLFIQNQDKNFISRSREFSLMINGQVLDGFSGWKLQSTREINEEQSANGIKIILNGKGEFNYLTIEINYMLYPGLPIMRKWINIINAGKNDIRLEALNIEDLQTTLSFVSSVVYHNYGRMKHLGRFVGNWDDPVVVVHDITKRMGLALGNESPSVLKRTAWHTLNNNIEAGLTHPGQDFPFRKWLKPGESWESPKTFIGLYANSDNGFEIINNDINVFVVNYMQPRIVQLQQKPTFVYNTWYPFRTFINESNIREIAKAASDCGIQEFIIDDGWQINVGGKTSTRNWGNNYGDWQVDNNKFPGGLKPVFDYIRSLGMKPGLWISIGSATKDAKVFQDHPEWFIRYKNNKLYDIHQALEESDFYSSCFGTGWFDYIKNVILSLVRDNGLAYAKLDLSVATSAYVNDNSKSGCYAGDHPFHRDHEESFIVIYERVLELFDELHKEAPGLFIDCTFETAGKLQLMDYAISEHAEGNWLSNFEEPSPLGPLRVRQMAWWRSPALPASSLVIGNLPMDDQDFEFGMKSLIGTLPIVLGDPRKLTLEKRASIKNWSVWMQNMQKKYDYMSYRKDLPGFGEPEEGAWDGWMRINFILRSGGIFGVFRQGAKENARTVFLNDLIPEKNYFIKLAPEGQEVFRGTGKQIMEEGFEVKIEKPYDGKIYEIGMVD